MDEGRVKSALARLNQEEIQILYWSCAGLNREEIGNKVALSAGSIYNRILVIHGKLEVLGVEEVNDTVCVVLEDIVGSPPDFENWPPVLDIPDDTHDDGVPEPDEDPQGRPSPIGRLWRGLVAIVTGVMLFFIGYFSGLFPVGEAPIEPAAPPVEPTAIVVTQVVTQVVTEIATQPPQATQPISEEEATHEPDIALVPTDLPEPTEEPTPESTSTPEPTETPQPTPTPTPANVYFDDLSDGVDESLWDIQYGRSEVLDGRTQIVEELYMVMGDGSWQNYEIRMQVVTSPEVGDNICVRCSGTEGLVIYFQDHWTYPDPGADIRVIESGNGRRIKEYQVSAKNKILTIQAEGANVQAWLDNENILDYVTEFESGYIGLELHPRSRIEWIEVTRSD